MVVLREALKLTALPDEPARTEGVPYWEIVGYHGIT